MIGQSGVQVSSSDPSPWGVVILNWNGAAETQSCITSVNKAAQRSSSIEVTAVVVDNGSSPECLTELVRVLDRYPQWGLVPLESNFGFARGMNAGIRSLAESKPEYILLLNSDTLLCVEAFNALELATRTKATDLIGLAVTSTYATANRTIAGYRYYPWIGGAVPVFVDLQAPKESYDIDYICGAAMLCRTSFLTRINGIPEASFLYFEELRLASNLADGEKPRCCTDAVVMHTTGTSAKKLSYPSRHYYAALACFRYTREGGLLKLPSVITARITRLAYQSASDRSIVPFRDGLLAVWDFMLGAERRPS